MRRIYFQPQIDDLFLSSVVFDPNLPLQDQEESQIRVRITGIGTFIIIEVFLS